MKLKALRVHGFKSFADPTQIDFHDGITAVVGPNGCGKSNISDAIRWVLGEQRPTAIRGAKMEEAIFQGSVARRPVNRGSVSMIVSNEDGALPVPYEEVEIGRTVYRDGGSDYQLNRANCRLKDVVDLCRDTGLGANAYSVIENRMIDAILSDRADERRSMFEEAAGIGKYKDRRKAALRRLETAEVDLQRLEDVISEVQTKVRSLARQKGKAQRFEELRARRLAVEVEVVRSDLSELGVRLERVEKGLADDTQTGPGVTAQLRTAEAELESTRIRFVEAQRARVEVAGQLEQARFDLAQVEKEVAVGEGRISYGDQRLSQIAEEAVELEGLKNRSEEAQAGVREEQSQRAEEFESVSAQLAVHGEATAAVRTRLGAARRTVTELEEASRENLKRIAQLEGDHEGAQLQVEELLRRSERVSKELESGAGTLSDLKSQGDLFSDHLAQVTQRVSEATEAWEDARSRVGAVRERLEELRAAEVAAESAASSLEGEHAAVGRMVDSDEGSGPAVEAVRQAFPKLVLGTLADCVVVNKGVGSIVDAILGDFSLGVVVKNQKAVAKLTKWFESDEAPGSGLVVLPLDAVPAPEGRLPKGVKATGAGAPWVEALLGGLSLNADAGKVQGPRSATTGGVWIDRFGAVHLLSSAGSGGTLERRDRLENLGLELEAARAELEAARNGREALDTERQAIEAAVEVAAADLFEARDGARAAEAEASARTDEAQRLDRHQEELSRQLQGTKAARERAMERGRSAEVERGDLLAQEAELHDRLEVERAALAAIDAEWEVAREAESVAAIEAARLENEVGRLTERLRDLEETAERAASRIKLLLEEREALDAELDEARSAVATGRDRIQTLFADRDQIQAELNERDETLEGVSAEASEAERRVRDIRAAERQAVDRRHQLELERQDIQNQVARIRERLEDEWGRALEVLIDEAQPVDGSKEELRAELQEIVRGLDRLGPVNMLAVEEHAEESERLGFLSEQRDDLVAARDDLKSAIRQINQTATELFNNSFEAIRGHFKETFERLFQGGQADLWLADPESPLESPVEIHASPAGKKTQRIDLLSGGERALTALSLLFGIYLVKPSPFCVLDEVDAPLDESNIGRFIRLLQSFKDQSQFVVITHNPRTIEAADWIYGVTMEEPGVSSIVGVRLQEALEASVSAA